MNTFPVTTSTLDSKFLGNFIKDKYALNSDFECSLFKTGINHTYFITDKKTSYAIRVYCYNWRSKIEIEEEIKILNYLKSNNTSISYPIPDEEKNYIQKINAPEAIRYAVLFSFAKGDKIRFLTENTCFIIGTLMANFHKLTLNKTTKRAIYNKDSLLKTPYKKLTQFFTEELPEMKAIKKIINSLDKTNFENTKKGIVHLDIWYDNMAIKNETKVTLFDFDFCGNGNQILDIGYFCNQLFNIEIKRDIYELKKNHFLKGYISILPLSDNELDLLPRAGLAVFIFYLGVQSHRFDWSNIFLTKNYLTMYVARLNSWVNYNKIDI